MPSKPVRDSLVALLALLLALSAAYWLDDAIFLAIQRAGQTFDHTLVNWIITLSQLLLAGGLVVLVGWLLTRVTLPRVIAVIYALVGLAAVAMFPLIFSLGLPIPFYGLADNGPVSLWSMTGAVLAVAGIWRLFQRPARL